MEEKIRAYRIPVYTVSLVRDGSYKIDQRPQVHTSQDSYDVLKDWFLDNDREEFVILMLNSKNKVIGINSVSVGSLSASLVHPREVFKPAILHNAAGIICAHNHPSGNPAPSQEDNAITRRLVDAGDMLGIRVLDHIILGDGRFYSYTDADTLRK